MWRNRIKPSKLGFVLFVKVIIIGIICIGFYLILMNFAIIYMDHMRIDIDKYMNQISEAAEDFQNYITENKISMEDTSSIREWDKKQKLMYIRLVDNNKVIYETMDYMSKYIPKVSTVYYETTRNASNQINFSDGTAALYIGILYKQRIEQRMDFCIGAVCVLLFCFAILHEFKLIVKDILIIEKGIHILENGEMSFLIHTNRKDEIADLADSINRMSKELEYQKEKEGTLRQKNYDLVTSISHDIRTPLTSVNSYIDLIMEKKYSDTTEMERYLSKIKEKSYIIKDLTDNLFNHFINQSTEYVLNYEIVTGNEFMAYLFRSLEEALKDKGYEIRTEQNIQEEFFLKIDVMQIQRVFNNMEGNLLKYALKTKPITYSAVLENNRIKIKGINYILNNRNIESHGVGINTCREIIALHSGEMECYIEEDQFQVVIYIPIYLV